MKIESLLRVVNTDEFIMINNENESFEVIRCYEKGSFTAAEKYFDKKVVNITPCGNAVEIRFI